MFRLNRIRFLIGCLLCFLLPSPAGSQDLGNFLTKYKRLDPDLLPVLANDPACTAVM